MQFRHRLKVQTRWTDFDMLGHVNNNIYFQYFDLAKSDYFLNRLKGEFDPHGNALVIVSINCDFSEPSLPGEPLEVLTRVAKIGDKSLTLEQQVVSARTGNVKCAARTIMVAFDVKTSVAIPVPDIWRTLITNFETQV